MYQASAPVPGRLRLRFTQLKQQTEQLAQMAAAMRAIGGVMDVEVSPITGGLLIHFDAVIGKTTAFWDQVEAVLLAHQLLLDPRPLASRQRSSPPKPTLPARDAGKATRPPEDNASVADRAAHPPAGNASSAGRTAHPPAGNASSAGRTAHPPAGDASSADRTAHPHAINASAADSAARRPLAGPSGAHRHRAGQVAGDAIGSDNAARPPARRRGDIGPRANANAIQAGSDDAGKPAARLAGGITAALLGKLIERSAIALVAALL